MGLLTIYADRFVPEPHQACARGPVIFIRPRCRGDAGLYRHELTHVMQWLTLTILGVAAIYLIAPALSPIGALLHTALYTWLPEYRLHCEVQSYRAQARCYPDDRRAVFARFIAERYGLPITAEAAEKLLRE